MNIKKIITIIPEKLVSLISILLLMHIIFEMNNDFIYIYYIYIIFKLYLLH